MSAPRLGWLLCCGALLCPAAAYVVVSSVSWAVTSEVDEELDSASAEDAGSLWQRRFPAAAHLPPPAPAARARPRPAPPGMFSYRRQSRPGPRSGAARALAHASAWGCLATVSAHDKVLTHEHVRMTSAGPDIWTEKPLDVPWNHRIRGLPFGNCMPISDGPLNNSTGIPFFYMTLKDPVVADLMKNPMASLLLPESEGELCRKNIVDPEDPRCARLTFTGQMITVSPEEVEFAKQAMFSRHPVMRKWPRQYEWFFMKMRIQHIWLHKWYGGVVDISREEYFKAVPRKA